MTIRRTTTNQISSDVSVKIIQRSCALGTATLQTQEGHSLSKGNIIDIKNILTVGYNKENAIILSVPSLTSFTYSCSALPEIPTIENNGIVIKNTDAFPYVEEISNVESLLNFIKIGTIFAFIPDDKTKTINQLNTELDEYNMVICDGSAPNFPITIPSNGEIYDNIAKYLPNLIDNRFLCGFTSSGLKQILGVAGDNLMKNHGHSNSLSVGPISYPDEFISFTHDHPVTSSISSSAGYYNDNGGSPNVYSNDVHIHKVRLTRAINNGGVGKYLANAEDGSYHLSSVFQLLHEKVSPFLLTPPFPNKHTHVWSKSPGTDPVDINPINIGHIHAIIVSPSGTIGSGVIPTLTDNRPNFLTCYFIIKHKNFIF